MIRLDLACGTTPSGRSSSVRFPRGRADLSRFAMQPIVHLGMRFPHFQCILQLQYPKPWMVDTMCAPVPRVTPVVPVFHSNLPFKVGTTVFVRGKWVEFGAQAINRIYRLMDDDSVEYKALFADIDYECLLQELTHSQGVWRRQPSTGDFTTFQMHSLTSVAKVWYNFLCVKIKPTLHLSTVTKDKTILLLLNDIGSVIERGLIEW